MSGAGKDADLKEKELSVADPGSFARGKRCFHCGFSEHMKYQCPKCKARKGVNRNHNIMSVGQNPEKNVELTSM